jgi:hypothetical protein
MTDNDGTIRFLPELRCPLKKAAELGIIEPFPHVPTPFVIRALWRTMGSAQHCLS